MDKVFSARIDESVVGCINSLARQLHSTKKQVIERAVELFAAQVEREQKTDVLEQSFGSWVRDESARESVESSRAVFRKSMERARR
jgi:predicted transcriptional regulator